MPSARSLIVNADDFGLSHGVNEGIIQTHEHGILTSTSLMVRKPAAAAAAGYARAHPKLSVGLHVDLCEWIYRDGNWLALYEVVPLTDVVAAENEVQRQLQAFSALMGRGPTHLDSHQHVHREEPVRTILMRAASRLSLPLRSFSKEIRYCGDFYGQANKGHSYPEGISVEAMLDILLKLPPGVTELGCHPGKGPEPDSMYDRERQIECETLCDPRVRAAVKELGIELRSFKKA
jgi:predicted glycoside hydrolase/deacetylase ChbG (UPF0249 family)